MDVVLALTDAVTDCKNRIHYIDETPDFVSDVEELRTAYAKQAELLTAIRDHVIYCDRLVARSLAPTVSEIYIQQAYKNAVKSV